MRAITHCPACQTEFFVSDEQLNKHGGKVRCGHCLHVFDAKAQLIAESTASPIVDTDSSIVTTPNKSAQPVTEPEWPQIDNALLGDDDDAPEAKKTDSEAITEITETLELSASPDEIEAFTAETTSSIDVQDTHLTLDDNDYILVDEDYTDNGYYDDDIQDQPLETPVAKPEKTASNIEIQPHYFDNLTAKSKNTTKAIVTMKKPSRRPSRWPWFIIFLLLLIAAIAQSVYFLRDAIANHYPNLKPYLVQACAQLSCKINLPKAIELIVIDDSDMQEDLKYTGLMNFTSNLINHAEFNVQFPNLELTLTDVDDKPILRRIFKPNEYLPSDTDVATGFKARDEIKIKLSITTKDVPVAGYRVYLTY